MKKLLSPGTIGGALVIGILGTALWENIFKPSSSWLLNLFVGIATLGVKSFQNDIYLEIAKGLHEDSSLRLMVLMYVFLLAIIVSFALIQIIIKTYKSKEELKDSKFYSALSFVFDSKMFFTFYFIITFVFFALDLSREVYVNQAVTYYTQLKTIIQPYLTPEQSLIIDSNFAQIRNSGDYVAVTGELENVASLYKLILPSKPTLVGSINYPGFW